MRIVRVVSVLCFFWLSCSGSKSDTGTIHPVISAAPQDTTVNSDNETEPRSDASLDGRPRIIVLTDISNEPDDEESLVRFLVYLKEDDRPIWITGWGGDEYPGPNVDRCSAQKKRS